MIIEEHDLYMLSLGAVEHDINLLQFVPYSICDAELLITALRNNDFALEKIPKHLRNVDLCRLAVENNGLALKYVPEELRDMDICRTAKSTCEKFLQFLPYCLSDKTRATVIYETEHCLDRFYPDEILARIHSEMDDIPF